MVIIYRVMQQMYDEEARLNPQLPLYHCNMCGRLAHHPVLPPCGHLYCWKCIHTYQHCPTCDQPFDHQDLFSLFIQNQQTAPAQSQQHLPPKPKPRYLKKIRNAGGATGDNLMQNHNNLARGVQLAGYGVFPPLIVNTMSQFGQEDDQDKKVKWVFRTLEIGLILAMLIVFLLL